MIVIAEIGLNHNGDLQIAEELIHIAADAGCDVVKFQKRDPDTCVPEAQKSRIRRGTPWGDIPYIDYRHHVEFGGREYDAIDRLCDKLGIGWSASSWDEGSFDFLCQYDLPLHKVPSPMITNTALLVHMARARRHTCISTGMSTMEDVGRAVEIFRAQKCPFELMHCVSAYPVPHGAANLRAIHTMRDRFSCQVGYSGHEMGLTITTAAVALGVTAIERHVTLDRSMWGSDQHISLEPEELRKLVSDCRLVEESLGDGQKVVLDCEREKQVILRPSLRRERTLQPELKTRQGATPTGRRRNGA